MNLLLLTEGDAERYDSWSGTAKSVVDHLRRAGHTVMTADVDLYGHVRWMAAARSFSPNRKRWGVRYHLGDAGYAQRSCAATRALAEHGERLDCILQIGATFEIHRNTNTPYALFCDSNIETSLDGAKFGVSDTSWLTPAEITRIRHRESRVYHGATVILTISEYLRHSFIESFGIDASRVVNVGAGPNLDVSQVPPARKAPRAGPPTVLFVGKQFERKGGRYLLEAFAMVRQRFADARLVIVGPPERPSADPGVEYLGVLDKNSPDGWARMVAAYGDADVFCLPSLFEPFGIVILEAMFFGLPCVGTHAWAIPEMIANGATGFTFPRGQSAELADRLCALLADRERARAMGLAGRARAEQRFSWPVVADRMTAAIERGLTAAGLS